MLPRFSIVGAHLVELTELSKVKPATLLLFTFGYFGDVHLAEHIWPRRQAALAAQHKGKAKGEGKGKGKSKV